MSIGSSKDGKRYLLRDNQNTYPKTYLEGLKLYSEDTGFLLTDHELGEFWAIPYGRLDLTQENKIYFDTALGRGSFDLLDRKGFTLNDIEKGLDLNNLPDISNRRVIVLENYSSRSKTNFFYKGTRTIISLQNNILSTSYGGENNIGEIKDGKLIVTNKNRIDNVFGPGAYDLLISREITLDMLINGFDLSQL